MNQLWAEFIRYAAGQSSIGEIRHLGGIDAAWVNSSLPFFN